MQRDNWFMFTFLAKMIKFGFRVKYSCIVAAGIVVIRTAILKLAHHSPWTRSDRAVGPACP
jgi:hypothetical protein